MGSGSELGRRGTGPTFWKEIHEFAAISFAGVLVALWVLTPRLGERSQIADLEGKLEDTVRALEVRKARYEAAIVAMESDPFYRQEVYRAVLGVKGNGEDFLQKPPAVSDNPVGDPTITRGRLASGGTDS
jgi:hypothetical protein